MTRINVIPVEELSDQHLIAEYRELPRCVKQDINLEDAPKNYTLGKGHMKWAAQYPVFLMNRYREIYDEMVFRGFNPNFHHSDLRDFVYENKMELVIEGPAYRVSNKDIELNRQRLTEKYNMKPDFYNWTNRTKPEWLQ